jgi:hypothetical protein
MGGGGRRRIGAAGPAMLSLTQTEKVHDNQFGSNRQEKVRFLFQPASRGHLATSAKNVCDDRVELSDWRQIAP